MTHTSRVPAESQSAILASVSPGRSLGDRTSTTRSGPSGGPPRSAAAAWDRNVDMLGRHRKETVDAHQLPVNPRLLEPSPLALRHAPPDMREELSAALDAETAIESRHVLMGRGVAQVEARGDLLLAVPFQQTAERLAEPRGESLRTRLQHADERSADQGAELLVKEVQHLPLAW